MRPRPARDASCVFWGFRRAERRCLLVGHSSRGAAWSIIVLLTLPSSVAVAQPTVPSDVPVLAIVPEESRPATVPDQQSLEFTGDLIVRVAEPDLLDHLFAVVTTGRPMDGLARAIDAVDRVGGESLEVSRRSGRDGRVLIRAELDAAQIEVLQRRRGVISVIPDIVVSAITSPSSPDRRVATAAQTDFGTHEFWGLDRLDGRSRSTALDGRYHFTTTGAGVDVFVLDTGIRATHIDFTRSDGTPVVVPSTSFTGGYFRLAGDTVEPGQDCDGHGSHVAGTVAGRFSGVAKGASVVPVRIFPICTGKGSLFGIMSGIDWVLANRRAGRPAVVNMSLGTRIGPDANLSSEVRELFEEFEDDIRAAIGGGLVFVVASGNVTESACWHWPARIPEVITVGATDQSDRRSDYNDLLDDDTGAVLIDGGSTFGPCVDISAPGSEIFSSHGVGRIVDGQVSFVSGTNSLLQLNGTSMAAPHVAGLAARFLESNPTAAPGLTLQATVAQALLQGASTGQLTDPLAPGDPADPLRGTPDRLATGLALERPGPSTAEVPVMISCLGGTATGFQLASSGGVGPYTWSTDGGLAGTLALSSAGRLTGSSTSRLGSTTVVVTDVFGRSASSLVPNSAFPTGCFAD